LCRGSFCFYLISELPRGAIFPVAIVAINRFVTARLEGNFCGFAALGAGSGEHLTSRSTSTASASAIPIGFPCLTAFRTALRLIGVAFRLEKFLIFSAEGKGRAAIGAGEGFVLKTHWMASSLMY
jgi:hypothetical protein